MKRRTLDIAFSVGGALLAVLFLILGLVLSNQASFAEDYVRDQLGQQKISFTPEDGLQGEQDAEGGDCLLVYAGDQLETGKQAECYANQYIAFHLREAADELAADTGNSDYEDATYATLGTITRGLQAEIDTVSASGEDTTSLESELEQANEVRDTMFRGETLRGLLLTTYGFSIFGERAELAAIVCFVAAALLLLLAVAGFVHAARTAPDERVIDS